MKKLFLSCIVLTISVSVNCQSFYYVFLTDKHGVEFNPYTYFDQKAIERRILNGISLYDSSDFPVNQSYINQIADLSEEYVGESRWFNMLMISASDENIEIIRNFSFVKNIVKISEDLNMKLANSTRHSALDAESPAIDKGACPLVETKSQARNDDNTKLSNQLLSLQGEYFTKNNINGKGVRIAVFDGGFPNVDTHEAFEHLRKNNQIVGTWNFPKKKENVYGWNSHGTMVLSCIAGVKKDGTMLGLATGAEFLLARTEVETEPKKEEFWWLQAVEWADKNGANVINSSLGYGIDRHYFKELDGKTTIVTKAANMAAAKGILVCNSAGNEGSDSKWYKIIAPADADSILTVGGIKSDLTRFERINFSSYGPTADGRMKPNVVAFGDVNAANPSENTYKNVQGTSFSSPLVAGFVACAWQTNRNLTAMELKTEIEKSASLYPYFDYVYGYGVPQASYFTENQEIETEKTFEITINDTAIIITPFVEKLDFLKIHYLHYNIQNEDGTLDEYAQINLYEYYNQGKKPDNHHIVFIRGAALNNKTINVFLNGYFESHKIEKTEINNAKYQSLNIYTNRFFNSTVFVDVKEFHKPSKWGYKAKHFMTGYIAYSMFVPPIYSFYNYAKSHNFDIGIRYKYNVNKWYAIGGNLEYGITKHHYKKENLVYYPFHYYRSGDIYIPEQPTVKYIKRVFSYITLEFFQRFNLGVTSFGNIYLDLGIYGSVNVSNKEETLLKYKNHKTKISDSLNTGYFNCGIKGRLGYGPVAIFAQFLHSNLPISLGVELSIPW